MACAERNGFCTYRTWFIAEQNFQDCLKRDFWHDEEKEEGRKVLIEIGQNGNLHGEKRFDIKGETYRLKYGGVYVAEIFQTMTDSGAMIRELHLKVDPHDERFERCLLEIALKCNGWC